MTLTDLTPKLVEIAREKAEEFNLKGRFTDFLVADARDLSKIQDEQFDASLMLGPMYHIQGEADRIKAIQELHRVTKKDGLQKVKRAIENVGGKIAGVVINKIPVNIEKYESTYYYSSSSLKDDKTSTNFAPKASGEVPKEKSDEIMKQLDDFLKNDKK